MIIISAKDLTHGFGEQPVFQGISWNIAAGAKIGLTGPNGHGKSTLLRILAGALIPDHGNISITKDVRLGYLPQDIQFVPNATVWTEALESRPDVMRAREALAGAELRMADPAVAGQPPQLARALAAYARLQEEYERLDGYRHESRTQEALETLGFTIHDFHMPVHTLSGGQKKMLGLAKLLAASANTLLLDEPDNHLDLAGKARLERFINNFTGAVIIVSHDRYLLDETVSETAELERGVLTLYQGNYTAYTVEKQLRLLRQEQLFKAQQKEIARIEAAIARFEYWASIVVNKRHIRQAWSRRRMLEKMDKIDKPDLAPRRMGLELNGWRGSRQVLEVLDVDKVFQTALPGGHGSEDNIVLAGVNLVIRHGERVGLIGPNGSGKSVFLRCILGLDTPSGGEIRIGPNVHMAYYAQEHETLDPRRTLIEEVRLAKPMYEQQAVGFLGRFLFPYQMVNNRIATLSGGERSRLQLALIMLADANFLLLDEPTNNLDLQSREVLEDALERFEGTVLAISHDRYFLNKIVDRIEELDDGQLTGYPGDFTEYEQRRHNS